MTPSTPKQTKLRPPAAGWYRTLIRDVSPRTPTGRAPKSVAGDAVEVSAHLVRDGHDVLAGRVRWRRVDPTGERRRWQHTVLEVDPSGAARCEIVPDEPGRYEFEVQAWRDRFATWRRDLRIRAAAEEDLEVEFLQGAELLERLVPEVPKAERDRLRDAAAQLRSTTCADHVRLTAGLDDAVEALTVGVPDPDDVTSSGRLPLRVDRELAVHGAWYEFFPRSEGGFVEGAASWERLEAVAAAGFDVLYLPPVHPIGTSHRKGRDNTLVPGPDDVGSPWAIGAAEGGHTAVHPDLGTVADVGRFVARARQLGVEVALDYALQCSPDHPWVTEHPEWFSHRADGSIRYAENPPKKYQDIYPIDFWPAEESDRVALWEACREILEFWIARGVRVFRVDNPHTKPLAFWEWMLREVQDAHPDTVFLSEAFTDPPMMHSLAEVGFSQSYTYFTWRHAKWELTEYGEELARGPAAGWFRPNLWPNTPDILAGQLRDGSVEVFRERALLAATLGPSWGVYSGYEFCENDPVPDKEEYHNSEKYEVKHRDHDAPDSLWPFLAQLNSIRRAHPAFARMDSLRFHHVDNDDVIAYSHQRTVEGRTDRVLIVVNLTPDEVREATVHVDLGALALPDGSTFEVRDELTGEQWRWGASGNYVRFAPGDRVGHVFSITSD
ncbi:MAG: alpha-1,4-glucan--maltose-1-phosphate maltosyltransferase [Actinomycetota bacterium]|nr:alpha-1,4-glucan--maltose-1-phosphate maltosyltransferase [Actinomycetota bacterium]